MANQPPIPDTLCYLNGDYTALKDAKISVLDRGFIFGEGVYEVVPAYAGKLFRFERTWPGLTAAWPSCAYPTHSRMTNGVNLLLN